MFGFLRFFFVILAISASLVDSQFTSPRNFLPAAYPLAVKAPYLNTWMNIPNGTTSLNNWPQHWDNSNIMGWSGFVRIDGVTWQWMGQGGPGNGTRLLSSEITPTQTKFTVLAGQMQLNITFLSPIEPSDWVKQSLPFIYLSFEAESIDGQSHNVQVYSDISAEWLSGNRANVATWQTTQSSSSVFHRAQLQSPSSMTEINDIASDSTVYYSMKTVNKMTYQTGQDLVVRGQFGTNGFLTNQQDTNFRAINKDFVVLGISVDLGSASSFTTPVVWGLGLVRDPVIQYAPSAGSTQTENRRAYYWTKYNTISDAIDDFLSDYSNAVQSANALDTKLMSEAGSVSSDYADLVAFGARQALASSDITVAQNSDGSFNKSDVKAFQRNTGFDRRVNAVERLYSTMPAYLYLNASLLGLHLDPLLQYQSSGYPNSYAAPDLGSSFPAATGDSSNNNGKGVEQSGNMLIMTLAHARISGDGTLIKKYYNLLKTWADYLVANTLYPNGQTSADGLSNNNMTNLAIKGIIGIAAMAEMSNVMGNSGDAQQYSANASSYVKLWQSLASSSGHLLPSYDDSDSSAYALIYNMYADRLLQTNLIDQSVYDSQATYYSNLTQSAGTFGLAYDTNAQSEANSAWTLFTAGSISGTTVTRDQLVGLVRARANFNQTAGDFPLMYNDASGNSTTGNGQASPGQGGMFALLALNVSNQTITLPSATAADGGSKSKSNAGTIAGAVVGSVVGVAVLALAGFFLWRRRQRKIEYAETPNFERPPPSLGPDPSSSGFFNPNAMTTQPAPGQPAVMAQAPRASAPLTYYGDRKIRNLPPGAMMPPSSSDLPSSSVSGRVPPSDGSEYAATSPTTSQSRTTASGSDTSQLRNDVENLRREMAQLRAERYEADVPPPEYT